MGEVAIVGGAVMACPICKRDTEKAFRPFCSRRCADVDLARWFTGSYAVPSQREEDQDIPENDTPTTH